MKLTSVTYNNTVLESEPFAVIKLMIKAIIFDCFGVFYTDPVFACMYNANTPEQIAASLHELDKQAAAGRLDKKGFILQASTLLRKADEDINEQFFHAHEYKTELVDFVIEKRSDYKTALLSNIGGDMMDGFFTASDYGVLFDEVVLSGNVGLVKPDPAIFELVCERLLVEPHEALMVDDMQSNVDAAIELGMDGICYTDFKSLKVAFNALVVN